MSKKQGLPDLYNYKHGDIFRRLVMPPQPVQPLNKEVQSQVVCSWEYFRVTTKGDGEQIWKEWEKIEPPKPTFSAYLSREKIEANGNQSQNLETETNDSETESEA
jgi:hypothetical protein